MSETTITPYLFFNGNCEEALAFYRSALGAEVDMLMRYGESPEPPPPGMVPPGYEKKIMHVSFRIHGVPLMASDGAGDEAKMGGFRLSLALPTEAEARKAFEALAKGGTIEMPIGPTFWSPLFGMVTDRFGLGWMVTIPMGPK